MDNSSFRPAPLAVHPHLFAFKYVVLESLSQAKCIYALPGSITIIIITIIIRIIDDNKRKTYQNPRIRVKYSEAYIKAIKPYTLTLRIHIKPINPYTLRLRIHIDPI